MRKKSEYDAGALLVSGAIALIGFGRAMAWMADYAEWRSETIGKELKPGQLPDGWEAAALNLYQAVGVFTDWEQQQPVFKDWPTQEPPSQEEGEGKQEEGEGKNADTAANL